MASERVKVLAVAGEAGKTDHAPRRRTPSRIMPGIETEIVEGRVMDVTPELVGKSGHRRELGLGSVETG